MLVWLVYWLGLGVCLLLCSLGRVIVRAMIQKLGIYISITCIDASAFVCTGEGGGGGSRSEHCMWWVGARHLLVKGTDGTGLNVSLRRETTHKLKTDE